MSISAGGSVATLSASKPFEVRVFHARGAGRQERGGNLFIYRFQCYADAHAFIHGVRRTSRRAVRTVYVETYFVRSDGNRDLLNYGW